MRDSYIFYKDKLKGEYLQTFDKVEIYCLSNVFCEDELEDILMEFMDMLLDAQRDGREVTSITGNNLEHFCKNFCLKPDMRSQIWEILNRIKYITRILFVLGIFNLFINCVIHGSSIWSVKSELMFLFLSIAVSFVVFYIMTVTTRIIMFRLKKFSMSIYNIILALSFATFIVITCILLSVTEEITVAVWIQIAGCIVYLIAFYIISYLFYKDKLVKQKEVKHNKITVAETVIVNMPQEIVKNYEKKNAKRVRFGKEPLTREAYSKKFCKSLKFDKFCIKWDWMIFVVTYASVVIYNVIQDGISLVTLIVALIVAALMIPGFILTRSTNRINAWTCEKIEEAISKDMNIIDYMEFLMKQREDENEGVGY